eukprot:5247835-Prymnesium_polylepis.3
MRPPNCPVIESVTMLPSTVVLPPSMLNAPPRSKDDVLVIVLFVTVTAPSLTANEPPNWAARIAPPCTLNAPNVPALMLVIVVPSSITTLPPIMCRNPPRPRALELAIVH